LNGRIRGIWGYWGFARFRCLGVSIESPYGLVLDIWGFRYFTTHNYVPYL
jgi:hypothetical protein